MPSRTRYATNNLGRAQMNLDAMGRVNKFNPRGSSREAKNAWRRKSNGGFGG